MQILSDNVLLNINGGSSIIICTGYGLYRILEWISKFLRFSRN